MNQGVVIIFVMPPLRKSADLETLGTEEVALSPTWSYLFVAEFNAMNLSVIFRTMLVWQCLRLFSSSFLPLHDTNCSRLYFEINLSSQRQGVCKKWPGINRPGNDQDSILVITEALPTHPMQDLTCF